MPENLKKQINVLMISARADFGGGPEHMHRLMSSLSSNFKIFTACPEEHPYWERFSSAAGRENMIAIPHRKFTLSDLLALKEFIYRNHIDIIHSHGKGGGIYGRLLSMLTQRPCVHTFHGLHIGNLGPLKKRIYLAIERFLASYTGRFISVSESECSLVTSYGIASLRNISVIHNAVRIPEVTAGIENFLGSEKTIVSLTRMDYAKYPEMLIDIAQAISEIQGGKRFRIIAVGPGFTDNAGWKQRLRDAGLEDMIQITGAVEDPSEYLLKSFCYISTSRWEGMPLGIMEAMACGLPVIATDVTGNRDLVENGATGFLYDISSPAQAASLIVSLAEKAELWKSLSAQARRQALEKFSLEQMASETERVYNQVVCSRQ